MKNLIVNQLISSCEPHDFISTMLTIFTIPKSFTDPRINIIQRNAIKSWTLLRPACEIFLVGNDEGVKETAEELKIKHIPEVKCNEFGTPLLNSAFDLAKKYSKNNILCYINSDIILVSDFIDAIKYLPGENFLTVGQRHDLDVDFLIDYKNPSWDKKIIGKTNKDALLHSPAGIDYFIYNKNTFIDLPELAVGRIGWDNWVIKNARWEKIKVIDASGMITAIHQNHGYPESNQGRARKTNPEAKKNLSYTKCNPYFFTIEDANYKLAKNGLKKKKLYWLPFLKRYLKYLLDKIK